MLSTISIFENPYKTSETSNLKIRKVSLKKKILKNVIQSHDKLETVDKLMHTTMKNSSSPWARKFSKNFKKSRNIFAETNKTHYNT